MYKPPRTATRKFGATKTTLREQSHLECRNSLFLQIVNHSLQTIQKSTKWLKKHLFVQQKFRTIEETRAAARNKAAAVEENHDWQQGFLAQSVPFPSLCNVANNVIISLGKGWRVDVQMKCIFRTLSELKDCFRVLKYTKGWDAWESHSGRCSSV